MRLGTRLAIVAMIGVLAYWAYGRLHQRPAPVPPPVRAEKTITIIPGWNLRQIADYLVQMGIASSTADVYRITGEPAVDYRPRAGDVSGLRVPGAIFEQKAGYLSFEGYIAPETYRIFADATLPEVLIKIMSQRDKEITPDLRAAIAKTGKPFHQLLTMASIVEREARTPEDRRMVADILWRREARGWALQVDSSVHYTVDRTGDVFTTQKEREIDSPWNTYKYPGLPPGPICTPSLDAIEAAVSPAANQSWYFLSGSDGKMHYAKTLDEHTANRFKYLR